MLNFGGVIFDFIDSPKRLLLKWPFERTIVLGRGFLWHLYWRIVRDYTLNPHFDFQGYIFIFRLIWTYMLSSASYMTCEQLPKPRVTLSYIWYIFLSYIHYIYSVYIHIYILYKGIMIQVYKESRAINQDDSWISCQPRVERSWCVGVVGSPNLQVLWCALSISPPRRHGVEG